MNNCEGYDYTRLRNRTETSLNDRLGQLSCEPDCGEKEARVTYLKFECTGHRATVHEKAEIICPRPGTTAPTGTVNVGMTPVNRSTECAVPGEDGNMTPPDRRNEAITDVAISTRGVSSARCPETTVFSVRYTEKEPGQCASFAAYQPYVDRAEKRATQLYYDDVMCGVGCVKQPVSFVRREWSCDAPSASVVVKLWLAVECKQ